MSADRLLGCRGDGDGDWEVWMSADDSEGGRGIFNEEAKEGFNINEEEEEEEEEEDFTSRPET